MNPEPTRRLINEPHLALLDATEVAELLGVPTSWVYAEARAGRLPHVRIGRYRRFRRRTVGAWIDAHERGPIPMSAEKPRRAYGTGSLEVRTDKHGRAVYYGRFYASGRRVRCAGHWNIIPTTVAAAVRIATLNLQHGSGVRDAALVDHIREAEIDLAVLTEFRASASSQRLLSSLTDEFPFVHSNPSPSPSTNGVAVISRHELRAEPATGVLPGEAHRWAEVVLTATGLRVVGLYVPGSGSTPQSRAFKAQFWATMLAAAPRLADGRTVVIGDLNTGLHRVDETGATFLCADQFGEFGTILVDAWRAVHGGGACESSWRSHVGNGFRIDHAFLSPSLAPLIQACWYDHAPRTAGSTDHAMLLLEIATSDFEE